VVVVEASASIGGGTKTEELTLPGFVHDVCSAVHPFAVVSPFFQSLPLADYGLEWIMPPAMVAHPLGGGRAVIVRHSIEETATALGQDGAAYRKLYAPLVESWPKLEPNVLGPPLRWTNHPVALARFGLRALQPADTVAKQVFRGDAARALFAGIAAHAMLPLEHRPTAGVALTLNLLAHLGGWCLPRGGAQAIANALASHLRALGGEIVTNTPVTSLEALPPAKAVLCDLSPRPLLRIAGHRFPPAFCRALERYKYGMGVYKVDYALDGPIPWSSPDCALAATVHVGGTIAEIGASERAAYSGQPPARPFVLVVQPTLFDPSRAPAGRHIAWTYCHVPHGSVFDMLGRLEDQIERFAPGFRERVLARSIMGPADLEARNANLVGGDIGAGVMDLRQLVTRPTWRTYSTPVRGLYLCSSSTPPGVGVHGMCGYFAAQRALRQVWRD
jgi:phytoene dehydrogenase-like protein